MPGPHRILTSANAHLAVTNIEGTSSNATFTLDAIPLTTVDGTATGRIAVPVLAVGGTGTSSNTVQGTAADNAASVGNPVYVGGLAVVGSTYAPAYTAGDAAALAVDKDSGGLLCHVRTLTTTDQITNTPIGYSFANVATNTTTTAKSGAGVLRAIVINKPVANGVITIYDNTAASGTKIATITLPAALTSDTDELVYDAIFSTGLTVVTSAATDITILYR